AREVVEQAEFGGGGGNEAAAYSEGHGRRIDFDLADFDRTRRKRTLEAAQHCFDAGDEFAWAERLGDVVVGTKLEAKNAVGLAAFCGQENHWDGGESGSLTNGAADFEAVFAGDHDVEHEECGALAFGVGENVDS